MDHLNVQAAPASPRRYRMWLILLALGLLALGVNRCLAPASGPVDGRADGLVLDIEDLQAAAPLGDLQRTTPPIDIRQAERIAAGASMGRFELPQSRQVLSWLDPSTGEQITSAAVLYDDPESARALDAAAAPLMSSVLGMRGERLELAGIEAGRRWTTNGYQAASFRLGGALILVGTTRTDSAEHLLRLAEVARARAERGLAALPTLGP